MDSQNGAASFKEKACPQYDVSVTLSLLENVGLLYAPRINGLYICQFMEYRKKYYFTSSQYRGPKGFSFDNASGC